MITIKAWKKDIAQLVEYKGVIKFKYLDSNNLDFSPIKMPIKNRQVYNFSHIDFQYGLPGLISDCLPGSYGMNYLDRFMFQYLKRKPTIFERLQFLGTHTLGALEFHPSLEAEEYKEVLNISKVYEESKKILNQENEKENNSILTLKTLIAVSNSAGGGARSKAIVGFNPKDKTISLTRKQGDFPKDYYPVIIKYDDQDISMYPTLSNKYKDASIVTKLEYLYYLFAKESGVNISPCELLEQEGRTHFLTYRFDLKDNERFHIHSLSGMMHYNPAETYNDFIDMFRISLKLNLSQKDKEEVVKVILFNAIFGNKDDHSKNFSFLMNSQGKWSFAPAYDLTYTSNGYHQMLLGNKVLNRALFEDLKNAFEPYNIKESFLKENIEKMIDIKHKKLVQEFINYDIPKNLANHILNETKIVDDNFGKEIKK
ncbi:type II toxin-antitoxin system HipA family toxin [Aliarcobacter cryaerophilus]|uniref:type II toxin-antitoxin system HipA family toxin n=1 Tax=Aliarcobacter cryaerophilus TaxID=28198 RepID=UPI0021B4DB95|nr:type II toxin-antitoxin system HipA family toxin [Aliarcobacter cryaerophilus]MCT7499879.1 type II toxin-antitoxin system HipA family toxin [Aliarcobacter cryaerophilus]